jgi:hypothetical protein
VKKSHTHIAVTSFECCGTKPSPPKFTRQNTVKIIVFLVATSILFFARDKKDAPQYGAGLIVNVPFPASEVAQVVQEVTQNGIIRGTKEYNKDEYVQGASADTWSHVFPTWTEGGQVFYKIRERALDPRNFKDSGDIGTLAVRYVVRPQADQHTVLIIHAIFVEDFRHTVHASNGSVESAEYKDIHDRLDNIAVMKEQTAEAEKKKKEIRELKQKHQTDQKLTAAEPAQPMEVSESSPAASAPASQPIPQLTVTTTEPVAQGAPEQSSPVTPSPVKFEHPSGPDGPPQTLEEHVKDLRRQVERLVKAPGAPLKSAPFHTASVLQALPVGTEVLIVITTPYWLGVETHEGQHGWMPRDDLELLP